MNNYIHVLDAEGRRITSIVDNILVPIGKSALLEQAKTQYPNATNYVYGDDSMLDQFLDGKAYVNGEFVDIPVDVQEKTKTEKIAEIKAYYDKRFETLEQMVLRRRLSNGDITDLQEQYKKLNMEMLVKIKAVK